KRYKITEIQEFQSLKEKRLKKRLKAKDMPHSRVLLQYLKIFLGCKYLYLLEDLLRLLLFFHTRSPLITMNYLVFKFFLYYNNNYYNYYQAEKIGRGQSLNIAEILLM
ncbi:MAG: hypothetical protein QW421_06235, partial [Archaeoglobaceae archaeon]